ncbi:MAG: D-aminoacylase [Synergistaceae bacterium]|jgi:N-acyl-D-amino-acid deacylase|nr:D-aminoacylase [Synergistaceae bacterium]
MADFVIRNATVIDGTGKEEFRADLAFENGRISRIGKIEGRGGLDAEGLTACPGFIDMHTHMDLVLLKDEIPDAKIRQGVTTDLLGQDGLGTAPVSEKNKPLLMEILSGLNGILPPEKWTWGSFGDYLRALERHGLAGNAAVLLSQGPVRIEVMGMDERQATPEELAAMKRLVAEGMEEGAFGLSSGLIYPPCPYADSEELTELNRVTAKYDGVFVVHQRDEGYYLSRSFDEVCSICAASGARLHVSHLQAYGRVNWPVMDEVLKKADQRLAAGQKITWDRYPYLAGCTTLTAVLPVWTFNEGTEALIKNLMAPEYRARIHEEFTKGLDVWHNRQISVGWDKILVTAVQLEKNRWMEGQSCQAIADAQGKNPIDAVCDLLAEEKLAVTMISFYGSDEVLQKVLSHPQATVGSDGIYGGRPHPRLYGTYPKFLKEFALTKHVFTLPEAVRRVTSFPASILGLKDRGVLKEGNQADVVLFDPRRLADTATYDEPERYPEGIPWVFVNGEMVVDESGYTGKTPGKVLRRGK